MLFRKTGREQVVPASTFQRFSALPGPRSGAVFRLLCWVFVLVSYLTAYHVWTGKPRIRRRPVTCTPEDARALGRRVAALRFTETVRAWSEPSLQARQAAWIAANAAFTLHRSKILDPKKELDETACRQMLVTWRRLQRASVLSRLGAREIPETRGAKLRAYVSAVDSSLQTYSVTVPPAYDPAVSWPLIVSMHGHGWYAPYQGHPAPAFKGAFCVSPYGRGATDYKDLGERDVLRVIEEVRLDYTIDPDRIYLRGSSMGGTGAWTVGVHYADRFAAILPIAANADYRAWTDRWGWNAPFEGRFDPLRTQLQEGHTARAFAENLGALPVYILHGGADTVVPPEHSRMMWERLRDLGTRVEYREFPGVGHGGFPRSALDEALAWICAWKRRPYPRRVSWKAGLMKHGKGYWVRLDQKEDPLPFARVDAAATAPNRVAIRTDNLRAFSILRTPVLFDDSAPLFVEIDRERVIFPAEPGRAGWVTVRKAPDGQWHDATRLPAPGLIKTAGLEGPVHEAFMAPFVLVVGTASTDPATRRFWLLEARRIASEWKRRNLAPCPFVRDVDVTPRMIANRNLILLGGAADNSITKRIQPGVPNPLNLLVARNGTDRATDPALSAPDVGWFTVYPNPENRSRLVVIHAANGIPAVYQAWTRVGNWFNWGVFDSKKYFDCAVYDAKTVSPESFLLLGYYGTDWGIGSGSYWVGESVVREGLAPQVFPEFAVVPPMLEVFDLVNLHPKGIDQMRGAVAFGRSYHGQPLPKSIGIRAPSAIEYELDGSIAKLITGCALLDNPESALCKTRAESEKVRFTVKGDGRVLGSALVSWQRTQAQIEADLGGVKILRLEAATAGGPAWLHGGAAWMLPRLYR